MRVCIVHLLDVYERLVGLSDDASDDQAAKGVEYAHDHLALVLGSVTAGFDQVLLAVEAGPSFRRHVLLDPEWRETRGPQHPKLAEGYRDALRLLTVEGMTCVAPPPWPETGAPFVDLGGGDCLPLAGLRGAGRDTIASVGRWWMQEIGDEDARSGEPLGDTRLRIVSGRSSLLCLADVFGGIEIVRDVRSDGSYQVHEREHDSLDPLLVQDVRALALCGDWERHRTQGRRSCLGTETARKLVEQHGSIETAVMVVSAADKWPGLSASAMAVVRAAAEDGGRMWRRALALQALRDDVPLDVAALIGGRDGVQARSQVGASVGGDAGERVREAQAPASVGGSDQGGAPHAPGDVAVTSAAPTDAPASPAGLRMGGGGHESTRAGGPPAQQVAVPDRHDARPPVVGTTTGPGTPRRETEETMSQEAENVISSPPTALAVHQSTRAVVQPSDFGAEHMRIVREAFAPTASQAEFEVMWAGAKARRLDPVRKQIHFVKRKQKFDGQWVERWTSIVSIDGFRAIAEQTGKYDGQDEPEYEYDEEQRLCLARVRVWRKDVSRPFVGVARWTEYVQTTQDGNPTSTWQKMEHTMLSKCAEALGMRKAFPEPLAGLYTGDEMAQADNERGPREMRQVLPPKTTRQRTLADRVAELARGEDIVASRATLVREMATKGIDENRQKAALADFDARAGA